MNGPVAIAAAVPATTPSIVDASGRTLGKNGYGGVEGNGGKVLE
jgi:hypothetical protein